MGENGLPLPLYQGWTEGPTVLPPFARHRTALTGAEQSRARAEAEWYSLCVAELCSARAGGSSGAHSGAFAPWLMGMLHQGQARSGG